MWSWYTSVYGGVNFRPQIVHSHLSIDISNYRPGSYNTSVNCHKTSALLYSLYRLLVRITGESSCAIQFDFLNQGPQDVYLWHGIDGAINILLMRDLRDARFRWEDKTNISDNWLVRRKYIHSSPENFYLSTKPELPFLFFTYTRVNTSSHIFKKWIHLSWFNSDLGFIPVSRKKRSKKSP